MFTTAKTPGASVRNLPLRDTHGKVIGKILDVVYTPDHRAIQHGIVELDRNGDGTKHIDISWDAVEFDEKGRASLRYDLGQEPLTPKLKSKKKKASDTDQAGVEVDFYKDRITPK